MSTRVHLWLGTLLSIVVVSSFAADPGGLTPLERDFRDPPASARPRTLWMWMNGNVTADGVTRDLEAMHRVGIGGAMIFNVGEFIPKGPIDYGSKSWQELVGHAAREANRLGLELGMHNCPGWSSSGGPWITPAMSMQQLVWTETKVSSAQSSPIHLSQPFTRLNYYQDIAVLAFPSLPGEERSFAELLAGVTNGQHAVVDKKLLVDDDLSTSVNAGPDNPLVFAFSQPFEARAVTVFYTSGGGTIGFNLEASDDGAVFRPVTRLTPASPRAIEDATLVETFEPVRAKFFRLTPNRNRGVCEVRLHGAPRIPAWNYKANFGYRPARDVEPPSEVPKEFSVNPAAIQDLTRLLNERGELKWKPPPGNWTVLRIGFTPRGQKNIAAPDAGIGLECDKMSREATTFHFRHGLGAVLQAVGPLAGKTFTGIEVDSYEVGVQNWTAGFEKQFKEQNGYELRKYLPAMIGYYVGGAVQSESVLWDVRRTQAELVADCYYGELEALCRKHGLQLHIEPYGAGPGSYDELQIGGRADAPMGEFWAHFAWDDIPSIKLAASAAHTYGKNIVAGESFTATPEQSRFLDYPYGLKSIGDLAFSFGLNRMYFHRFAHQPHPTAVPGMTMGPWGFNFDRNNTWFEQSGPWLEYLARCQFLLQQGTPVADVLYFTGEGSPRVSKRMRPGLPFGYDFDAVDAEALRQARVDHGRIVLEGGSAYSLLLLQSDLKGMTAATLKKIRNLVKDGATIAGPKPVWSPSFVDHLGGDEDVRPLLTDLWGESGILPRGVGGFGRGKVMFDRDISGVLEQLALKPDFEYTGDTDTALAWTHRRKSDTDIYFVANRQRKEEDVNCTFRISGKRPEFWNPSTGEMRLAAIYEGDGTRTRVPLHLGPAESVFVIFRDPAAAVPLQWLKKDGQAIISTARSGPPLPHAGLQLSVNSFTVMAWIKPDTDLTLMPQENATGRVDENGKSWVLPMSDVSGSPEGSAGMGIAAGRNGVFVAERVHGSNSASAVLVSRTPISGWTHLAVVYRDGTPSLYLNGKLDRAGVNSGRKVFPAIGTYPTPDRLTYYFDGDMTAPRLMAEALDEKAISDLAAKGLPAPELPSPIELSVGKDGTVRANCWSGGEYSLSDGRIARAPELAQPIDVPGPWHIEFPAGTGAPESITLTNLTSLRCVDDSAVRYFSGTATYQTSFEVTPELIASKRHLWLDLGRVAVMAEVLVNGQSTGVSWAPPFRCDVTRLVRPGTNHLEVRVTTLLANRMIGDEQLPAENAYDPSTKAVTRLPDWYVQGKPKPSGGRQTFATWKFYSADDPLVESGLLGPVRLLTSVEATFEK